MTSVALFVYGSLRRDAAGDAHPLLRDAHFVASATVRGVLYLVDWYPGLALDDTSDSVVHGELFQLPAAYADAMLAALDDYEGGGFRRRQARVIAGAGGVVDSEGNVFSDAWVYEYVGPALELSRIASGDYGVPVHRARP